MVDLSGYWFLDGIDVWKNFAIAIEKGTSDTLRYPAFKPPISHDWPDQNGIDVDLTKKFFIPLAWVGWSQKRYRAGHSCRR